MVPLFPIIPIHEGSWSGDDPADHIDDQHHDSDHPNHTNDHSLDSNISAASSVGHIDHNYYIPNWSSEYNKESTHSFRDDSWVNKDLDSSSWPSSFYTTRANYEADTHLDNENNLDDVRDSAYVSPRDQLVGVVHHHYYYPKNRYPDNSWQDSDDSDNSDYSNSSYDSSSSSCSTNSCDSSSFSCSDSDGDGDCAGDND